MSGRLGSDPPLSIPLLRIAPIADPRQASCVRPWIETSVLFYPVHQFCKLNASLVNDSQFQLKSVALRCVSQCGQGSIGSTWNLGAGSGITVRTLPLKRASLSSVKTTFLCPVRGAGILGTTFKGNKY